MIAGLAAGTAGASTGVGLAMVLARGLAWLLAADGAGPAVAAPADTGGAAAGEGKRGEDDGEGDGEPQTPNRVCLDGLRARQVTFVEWPTKGVRTPVKIMGPLGAVNLRSHDPRSTGKTVLMDCELARALMEAGPAFKALGVRELQYSGAYQYRTRRHSSRLSEHAHGLAIDVHAFVVERSPPAPRTPPPPSAALRRALASVPIPDGGLGDDGADGGRAGDEAEARVPASSTGQGGAAPTAPGPAAPVAVVEVTRDFEPGVGRWAVTAQDECIGRPRTAVGRTLRTLACRLRASSVFREVITPDDNADHHDHFHLEAFPDALSRTRAVLARKPSVTDD